MRTELLIFKNLISNEEYTRKVLPFLKEEYFKDSVDNLLFKEINDYILKYNSNPTYEALIITFNDKKISEDLFNSLMETLQELKEYDEKSNLQWIIDKTEQFCKDKSIYLALRKSLDIIENRDKNHDVGAIPAIMQEALAVGFDKDIGLDYLNSAEHRYEYYTRKEEKIPFGIDYLNKITNGGFSKKTLNVFVAGSNVGKTLTLCDLAANYLVQGKNVVYFTMEMSEEEIAKRIDANLLDYNLSDLENVTEQEYIKRFKKLKDKIVGDIIVKQYPIANALDFDNFLNELDLKKNFKADAVIVDYLGLCSSVRFKGNGNVNSYNYVKAISEEIRAYVGIRHNVVVVSAGQLNRNGSRSSDPTAEDIAESMGIQFTGDFVCVIITSDELASLNQYLFKQLKSRYSNKNKYTKFVIGVDYDKQRLYNVESSAQEEIVDIGTEEILNRNEDRKRNFEGFKF